MLEPIAKFKKYVQSMLCTTSCAQAIARHEMCHMNDELLWDTLRLNFFKKYREHDLLALKKNRLERNKSRKRSVENRGRKLGSNGSLF